MLREIVIEIVIITDYMLCEAYVQSHLNFFLIFENIPSSFLIIILALLNLVVVMLFVLLSICSVV